MKAIGGRRDGFILVLISLMVACHADNGNIDRENNWMLSISDKYNKEKNPDQSLSEINYFLKSYPNSFIGWNFATITNIALGNDSLAWECVEKSIRLGDSTNYGAFTNKAILLDRASEYERHMSITRSPYI